MTKLIYLGNNQEAFCFSNGIDSKRFNESYPRLRGHIHIVLKWNKRGYDELLNVTKLVTDWTCKTRIFKYRLSREFLKTM